MFHSCKLITKTSRAIIHKRYNLLAVLANKTPLAILFQKQHTVISHTMTIIYARYNLPALLIDISNLTIRFHPGHAVIESRERKIVFTAWQNLVALLVNRSP